MNKKNKSKWKTVAWAIILMFIAAAITQLGNCAHGCYVNHRAKKSYSKALAIALESVSGEIGSNQRDLESSLEHLETALQTSSRVMLFKQPDYSEWETKRQTIEDPKSKLGIAVLNNVQVIYRLFYAGEDIINDYEEWQNKIDELERIGTPRKATDKFREEITNKTIINLKNLLNDISARIEYISDAWNSRRDELKPYLN